jgi:hypothetical protein
MRHFPVAFAVLALFAPLSQTCASPSIVDQAPARVETFSLFEWTVEGDPGSLNPFDPDEASLEGVFHPPTGGAVTVQGFWTQDYSPLDPKTPVGAPHWCLRFSPTQAGRHTFTTRLRLGGQATKSAPQTFEAVASSNRGFVRDDSRNGLFFTWSTGGTFYPVGLSVAWTSAERLLEDYERYFSRMAENGGNLTRIWTCEWNLPLEWGQTTLRSQSGAPSGRYRLDSAHLLDQVLTLARRHQIKVILTLNTYGELLDKKGPWNEQSWDRNPYHRRMGGPCDKPWDYFTNQDARRMYRNRLRYVAARWGWSPELFAVEFFNEVNTPADWAKEMVDAFRAVDPNRHLVSSSVAWPWGVPYDEDALWKLPGLSPVMRHYYGSGEGTGDLAEEVRRVSLEKSRRYGKPFFYEELGLDAMKDDAAYDPKGQGTHLHNALWAAATGLSAATPLSHWKEYVDQWGLYREFKPLRAFVDSVDWGAADWEPYEATALLPSAGTASSEASLSLDTRWDARPSPKVYVSSDGSVEGRLPAFLKTTLREGGTTVHLETYAPDPVTLRLVVEKVSTGADLRVWVDGKEAGAWAFDPKPGSGDDYRSTSKDPQWNVDIGVYQKELLLPLRKGRHRLRLENRGADWLCLSSASVSGIQVPTKVKLYGLVSASCAVGWIQDKRHTWRNVYKNGYKPLPIRGARFKLPPLPSGTWVLRWWDTRTGLSTPPLSLSPHGKTVELSAPEFKGDIAFTLTRQDAP